ncbi:MAG: AMP-binding enzyme [Beijerinckiaceae bacterium]
MDRSGHRSRRTQAATNATEAEILAFCKQHLAGYKVPKKVIFAPSLPMTPNGKILKRKTREGLAAQG